MSELEEVQERIEYEISTHKLRQPQLTEKQIKYLLAQYCRESDEYDNKICITYNLTNQDQSMLQSTLEIVNNPAKADEYSILRGLYKGSNGGR